MRYEVAHTTKYIYDSPASLCHNIVYQTPRNFTFQQLEKFNYTIKPEPNFLEKRVDFYDNDFLYFSVQQRHRELIVVSQSIVKIDPPAWIHFDPGLTPPWETVVNWLKTTNAPNDIRQFYLESHHVNCINEARDYCLSAFTPNRPIMEAMLDLNARIFNDFEFTPGFTEVSTPLEKVFQHKKGVCQDFAHFGLACLRSIGLSARYMSGYIETIPPPSKPKLLGADASHAWIALFIPDHGWVEFDSTNNILVSDQHIRVAFGRDFADVVPLKGIVYSSGEQEMKVEVNVNKLDA